LGLLAISTIFIICLMSKLKLFRIITFVVSIGCIILISILNTEIKERNIDLTIKQLGIDSTSSKINIFSPQHESHFVAAWQMFEENPIHGVGPNLFRKLCDKPRYEPNPMTCSTHPHNTYIQLLSEVGIIGFLIFLLSVFYVSKVILLHIHSVISRKKRLINDFQVCLLACFVLTLYPFLPTLNFFNNWINVIYFLPIGFYLQTIYR